MAALMGCLLFTGCTEGAGASSERATASSSRDMAAITTSAAPSAPYGVFLGLNPEDMARLSGYDLVVIDAAYYTAEQIAQMHDAGQTVYTYLNIGSVERFREYYDEYESLTLGVYEDWPDERWVDVSQPEWQSFIVDTLATSFAKKGVDGFFLDNADVYYVYPGEEIYQGLVDILSGLGEYGLPLVINGGDTFITRLMEEDRIGLIDGVNQESVFTSIDFNGGTFGPQNAEDHVYYIEYLSLCRNAGLNVWLLEYAFDPAACNRKLPHTAKKTAFCIISPTIWS